MQFSPVLLALIAAVAVIASPAPLGELVERTAEPLANPTENGGDPDWKRGDPDWKRGDPDWRRGDPDWKRD